MTLFTQNGETSTKLSNCNTFRCDRSFHDSTNVRGGGVLFAVNNALSTVVKFKYSYEYEQLDILF